MKVALLIGRDQRIEDVHQNEAFGDVSPRRRVKPNGLGLQPNG
jgi:hypothetical protein